MFKNYILLYNNILQLGNTKESMFGSNRIKINLQLWHRIWISAILWCTHSVLAKAGSAKGAPTKDCHLECQFPMGLKYYWFENNNKKTYPVVTASVVTN